MSGPLTGLRVVALSDTLCSAHVSQLFADFGAEVVQIEPPGGSALRTQPAFPFWYRGTQSIELDLQNPADREVARNLALSSDVVVETFRPGVSERLGLDYDSLAPENPGLIHASITAFGRTGPYAHLKGYEGIVLAKIGAFDAFSAIGERPGPAFASVPYCTFSAAQVALHGILAALYERETSGRGQRVETTLVQGIAAHDPWNWLIPTVARRYPDAFTATAPVDTDREVPNSALWFRLMVGLSADGRWLQFSQTSDRLWLAFLRALGFEWMLSDPEWKDAAGSDDIDTREAFWVRLIESIRSKTVDEWNAVFDEDPNVFAEVFRTGTELLHHPQTVHNGHAIAIEDAAFGPVLQPGPLVEMRTTPASVIRSAPTLDADGPALRARPQPHAADNLIDDTRGAPPLAGVTVVELGTYYAAPFGATILAELGARVIKVEQLDGDPVRWILPLPELGAVKVTQGKESVAVDIATPEGREIVHELVRRADVVLQSFRAGVATQLGVDDHACVQVNPDLVYLNAPGYGVDGPYGHHPAYAPTIGAGAGLTRRTRGSSVPEGPDLTLDEIKHHSLRMTSSSMAVGHADGFAALTVATALLLGLYTRRRGKPGQSMLTTMLNSMAHVLSEDMVEYDGRRATPATDVGLYGLGARYRLYETAEGWVFLAAPTNKDRAALVKAIAPYGDLRTVDAADDDALASALAEVFRTRPADEWERDLSAVDVGCVVVAKGPSDAALMGADGVCRTLGMVFDADHPVIGTYSRLKPMVTFSRSGERVGPSCRCGEHTDAVLHELGYTDTRIDDLRRAGIVGG